MSKQQVLYEIIRNEEGIREIVEHITLFVPPEFVPCHIKHVYPFEQDHLENERLRWENKQLRLEIERLEEKVFKYEPLPLNLDELFI